jgi:hypothetical protein
MGAVAITRKPVIDVAAEIVSAPPVPSPASERREPAGLVLACLSDVAYPMRRIDTEESRPRLTRSEFDEGWQRLVETRYPAEQTSNEVWERFAELRTGYASTACQLLSWTMATPAPWSGERQGFPGVTDRPDAPKTWSMV